MKTNIRKKSEKNIHRNDREYIANTYVMGCFTVTMILYFFTFMLNILNIFIIDQSLMLSGFVPSLVIYFIVYLITRRISLSDAKTKYFLLFSVILVYTIIGVTITYHVVLIALLPILYATLYTSKKVMGYVFGLTVISILVVVYGGYYFGLCDANMALLTVTKLDNYIVDGHFTQTLINSEPALTLLLFFVVPRCLIYIAFMTVCTGIYRLITNEQKKVKEIFIQTVTALSEAVDAKDRYTSGHSKRVAEYSRMIAERMGKSKEEQEEIYRAGLLHDVGKIRVPEDIINKPGKLTEQEFDIIKIHPDTGYHILKWISGGEKIALGTKYHHERYDGKGYPHGLAGENIPEIARILCVADSYDAMASNRSYRKALPQETVRNEIIRGRGTQFDPAIADVMLQMIDEDKEYKLQQSDLSGRKILVVDDEPMNVKFVRNILRDEPRFEIIGASGGKEALQILEETEIDLILLDVIMPEMDGLETLKQIRMKHQIAVALMTADKELTASSEFKELGCDDFITKPFMPLLLIEVIRNMCD